MKTLNWVYTPSNASTTSGHAYARPHLRPLRTGGGISSKRASETRDQIGRAAVGRAAANMSMKDTDAISKSVQAL